VKGVSYNVATDLVTGLLIISACAVALGIGLIVVPVVAVTAGAAALAISKPSF
jgi:hypothetical protein